MPLPRSISILLRHRPCLLHRSRGRLILPLRLLWRLQRLLRLCLCLPLALTLTLSRAARLRLRYLPHSRRLQLWRCRRARSTCFARAELLELFLHLLVFGDGDGDGGALHCGVGGWGRSVFWVVRGVGVFVGAYSLLLYAGCAGGTDAVALCFLRLAGIAAIPWSLARLMYLRRRRRRRLLLLLLLRLLLLRLRHCRTCTRLFWTSSGQLWT